MVEKTIDDLVMTPQEAAKVLKELVSMGKVRVPDIEVALASVRRRRMEKKDAKKEASPSKSSDEDAGRIKRGKGRQKVRAQASSALLGPWRREQSRAVVTRLNAAVPPTSADGKDANRS